MHVQVEHLAAETQTLQPDRHALQLWLLMACWAHALIVHMVRVHPGASSLLHPWTVCAAQHWVLRRIQVLYEHSLESVDFDRRTATFSSPAGPVTVGYDLLIAADGKHSKLRRLYEVGPVVHWPCGAAVQRLSCAPSNVQKIHVAPSPSELQTRTWQLRSWIMPACRHRSPASHHMCDSLIVTTAAARWCPFQVGCAAWTVLLWCLDFPLKLPGTSAALHGCTEHSLRRQRGPPRILQRQPQPYPEPHILGVSAP